ncbi:hypothetical protein ACIBFB_07090 [Nocardiopsis sp. NPDC050513]|uniref:hypothetical protein n=1 Tax=Nocardiopsis sp. NPDC050513 TaxID=3364338 RepID=UPI00378C1E77
MSDFAGGSREKTIVFGIVAVLVAALVFLGFQLLPGSDDEGSASDSGTAADENASATGGGSVDDVMSLLPHSEADLATGAEAARQFIEAYGEVDPDESDEQRLDRLSPMVSEEFFGALEYEILGTPNSGSDQNPQRTSASATVTGIRNIGTESVIFEVEVRFLTDTGDDGGNAPLSYAVTMVPEGGGWVVYAFQDAALGNLAEEA